MRAPFRSLRFLGHVALSAASFAWFAAARRGGVLVFTHLPDVDAEGRDAQMGPLVDALLARGERLVEVTLVSLDGGLLRNLWLKRRPFVSHAVLAGLARGLTFLGMADARLRAGRALLRATRPRVVFLIDESGSGQLLLVAARSLGIRTVGLQHGDFQPGNPQYDANASIAAADVLCVWSEWFRRRLLAVSTVYTESNTRVVGRPRHAAAPDDPPATVGDRLRVLFVSEVTPGLREEVAPFLEALRADTGIALAVQPHPAEARGSWPAAETRRTGLGRSLKEADVVCGVGSSALLEALHELRPAITLATRRRRDPSGYAAGGACESCEDPEALSELCRRVAREDARNRRERRERVWGPAGPPATAAILACAQVHESVQVGDSAQVGGAGFRKNS